ncbi:right-handed parallel beta-helix repeat-containing protein [Kribbella sancticallisti]|uniref:Right-handed parallel beta-helix repeat-containing protein n=1 Tax=Kribbella sancticallisti TaxID=460087 RepID=A0ABP4NH15_9ACTN
MEQRDSSRSPGRGSAWYRHRLVAVAVGLVLVAGLLVAIVVDNDDPAPGQAQSNSTAPAPTPPLTAPSTPTAKICGNTAVLSGPATAPAGAVTVATTQNLNDITKASPAGTTFWLQPGTHSLGAGPFSQVIPKEGNTYLGAPGAVLDGGRVNRYAFTGYVTNVTIKNLTIQNFGAPKTNNDEGVVNHNAAIGWTIEGNTIRHNAGAGVMVGSRSQIRGNCLQENGQYGFNAYNPDKVAGITIENNEIAGNNTDDWEAAKPGCGCTGGGKFWEVTGAVVRGNWVHHNRSAGLWADTNNTGFAIEGNYFSDNTAEAIVYETSYNASIRGNTFVRNGLGKGPANGGFPTSAVYISESGSDKRVAGMFNQTFEISGNVFTDNWAGVILWENADRFAGSPANTSTGSGTLVNPATVTVKSCVAANIGKQPYLGDCRWKTQNVHVHGNTFSLDPNKIGKSCASRSGCGYNGLFSNWGTFPVWSPYKEKAIQQAITFDQGNRFYANTYRGPWNFIVHEQGNRVNWAAWQGAPYVQDRDSVIKVQGER